MAKPWAKAFYRTKLWQDARTYALKRDRYLCQRCKTAPATEVHHKVELTPDNINDPNVSVNPDNLMSLCGSCHKHITQQSKTNQTRDIYFDANGNPVEIPPGGS